MSAGYITKKRISRNGGFTIMEVMIAIVISSALLAAVGVLLVSAARINAVNRDRKRASELAETKIEELRRVSFGSLISDADTVDKYTREWDITTITANRTKYIKVTVSWLDSKDREHSIIFNTALYRNAYPYR